MLGNGHHYQLHSDQLRRGATFFAERLTEDNTPVPVKRGKDGQRIRWKFELVKRPAADDTGAGVLEMLVGDSFRSDRLVRRDCSEGESFRLPILEQSQKTASRCSDRAAAIGWT